MFVFAENILRSLPEQPGADLKFISMLRGGTIDNDFFDR